MYIKRVYHSFSFPFDEKIKEEITIKESFFLKNLKMRKNSKFFKKIFIVCFPSFHDTQFQWSCYLNT